MDGDDGHDDDNEGSELTGIEPKEITEMPGLTSVAGRPVRTLSATLRRSFWSRSPLSTPRSWAKASISSLEMGLLPSLVLISLACM